MLRVLVLAGGMSEEWAVSLRSGQAVAQALQTKGHKVTQADPADKSYNLESLVETHDVVFPALHGKGGEDGGLQQHLEKLGAAYVGSDSKASALCFDKNQYSILLSSNDIEIPETILVDRQEFEKSELTKQPYVLKPNNGGSSIDTFIVRKPDNFKIADIHEAFGRHQQMLLQNLIEGVEITVSVLEDKSLPVIEIVPPTNQEFDYINKYNGATQELCPPEHVKKEIQQQAQVLALQIHHLTGCRDLSRTDIIVDNSGTLFTLETNTIPGLTNQSLLPKAAAVAGYDMPTLADRLVQVAYSRKLTMA